MSDNNQQAFFVDDELVERLLRGDAPVSGKTARPATSTAVAEAVRLASGGQLEEAAQILEAAARRGEDPAEIHAVLGHIRFEQQRWEDAAACYAKLASLDPQHPSARYNLGLALERQAKFGEAASEFEAAARRNPQLWQANVGLGLCLLHTGQWEAALHNFDIALQTESAGEPDAVPGNDRALFGKAVALHQLGRLDEAGDLYRRLLPSHTASEELLVNLIALSATRSDTAKAHEYADRLLKLAPQSRVAVETLAAGALANNDPVTAAHHYAHLVKLASDSYDAWFNLGVAQQRSGNLEQAALAYQEALRIRPDSPDAGANLGAAQQLRGHAQAALESYRQALIASPDRAGILWNAALAAEQAGYLDDAISHLERLLRVCPELAPEFNDAAFRLGFLQIQRNDYAGAVDSFELHLRNHPDSLDALLNLGLACWKFEDLDTAATTFERALGVAHANPDALRALLSIALERKDTARARDLYYQLEPVGGLTFELAYNLGLHLQECGQLEPAADCYRKAIDLSPGQSASQSHALLNLGHALRGLGQEDEARQVWDRAVEADPALASSEFR